MLLFHVNPFVSFGPRLWLTNVVFLRALEYYAGALFLTTNRVATFDEAFRSRIHLSLHYPTLPKEARKKIWFNMTRVFYHQGAIEDESEIFDYLDDLAKYELNGRQIRNALLTSSRIAEAEKRQTRYDDLVKAITQMSSFDNYLRQVRPTLDAESSGSDDDDLVKALKRPWGSINSDRRAA
jgi:hypothetical protein